jgi:hypothetical protein
MRCGSGTVSIVPIGGIVLILGFLLDAAAFVTVFGAGLDGSRRLLCDRQLALRRVAADGESEVHCLFP